jgi:uncharacterized membrane protein YhfC
MISSLSILCMAASATVSIGLPIGLFLGLRNRLGLKAVPMLLGGAGFILFALILEQMFHLLMLDNGSFELKAIPILFVVYLPFAAGLFEETARFVIFHLIKRSYPAPATGVSYGVGHGGIESILLAGVTMIANLIVALSINAGGTRVLEALPDYASQLANTAPAIFLVGGLERISAICLQIALSIMVWTAVNRNGRWWLYPAAIGVHAGVDLSPSMYQAGMITSLAVVEGLTLVWAVVLGMVAAVMYRRNVLAGLAISR